MKRGANAVKDNQRQLGRAILQGRRLDFVTPLLSTWAVKT
jgi:hypothetical protein